MTFSSVAAEQREQQQQQLKKFMGFSLLASALLHGALFPLNLESLWQRYATETEEPIEFVVLEEEPEPETPEPEPKPEPPVAPTPEAVETPPPEPEATVEPEAPEIEPELEPLETELPQEIQDALNPVEPPPLGLPEAPVEPETPPLEEPAAQNLNPFEQPEIAKNPPISDSPAVDEPAVRPEAPPVEPLNSLPSVDPAPISPPDQAIANSSPSELENPVNERSRLPEPPVVPSILESMGEAASVLDNVEPIDPDTNLLTTETESPDSPTVPSNEIANDPFRETSRETESPIAESPVTTARPNSTSNSEDWLNEFDSPNSEPDIASSNTTPSVAGEGDITEPTNDPFNDASGLTERSPIVDTPVATARPGGGDRTSSLLGDVGNTNLPSSFGDSNALPSYSESGGGGDSNFSDPFAEGGPGPMASLPSRGQPNGTPDGSGSGDIGCLRCNKPNYPRGAREAGLEGQVQLSLNIAPDGSVIDAEVIGSSGYQELDIAAKEAVMRWRFERSDNGIQGKPANISFSLDE